MKQSVIACCLALMMASAASAEQEPVSGPYGERLEGFSYPFELRSFAFESQGQSVEMAYMDVAPQGQANGQSVVLLHGKNFCGATWEETIRVLSGKGYRVIVPDQIGFCKSSKPDRYQYSLPQLALNTHQLLTSLEVTQPIMMGHSMGGMLLMRYALAYPQHVQQMVLVNPIGLEDWQAKGVPYAPVDALYQGELKTSYESIKAYQLSFYYNGIWKPEYDRWVHMQAGMYAGAGRERVALTQAQTSDMIFTQPVVHELSSLTVPTLLLIGEKDRTAPGAARAPVAVRDTLGDYPVLGRHAASTIADSVLVTFPQLGHSPQVEDPAQFHDALLKHIR